MQVCILLHACTHTYAHTHTHTHTHTITHAPQHEMLSQKVFKDKIYQSLKDEFEKYGITESDIDFIAGLIHYEPISIPKDNPRAFLYQVCILLCS